MTPEQRLAALIEMVSGVVVGEQNLPKLRAIAHTRATVNGFPDRAAYVEALRRVPEGAEWREVLSRITVKESSLFRGPHQFEALARTIVPGRVAAGRGPIRIWSAGCARGEETATLAVTLAECPALAGRDWSILGTDVDEMALDRAQLGVFPRRSLRRVPPAYLDRYFERQGDRYRLVATLREKIRLRYLNLMQLPQIIPEGPFDAIFLRNVLIYFREDSQARVAAAMAPHLAEGGYLFVGPSESLRQVAPQYEALELGQCFAYQITVHPGKVATGAGTEHRRGAVDRTVWPSATSTGFGVDDVIAAYDRGDLETALSVLGGVPGGPEDPMKHAMAGFLAEKEGRLDDAVRAYRAASYLDHSLFQVRFMMAQCLARSGWSGRAIAEFRALADLLGRGQGSTLPWADRLGLPDRAAVVNRCIAILEDAGAPHHSTAT